MSALNQEQIYSTGNLKRIRALGGARQGSGHDTFLKGIVVQFDLKYPQYLTPQLQRYHWIDIISSQSKMHSLTKMKDTDNNYNKYVFAFNIEVINALVEYYNECDNYPVQWSIASAVQASINSKEEMFQYIISNLPMGFELWMGISTNYLQLKTVYKQRKTHDLEEWRDFCKWIETLPMSYLITKK